MKGLSLVRILLPMSFSLCAVGAEIMSIDYTAHLNPYLHSKTGLAAAGDSTNDFWNVYSRDISSSFDWRSSGTIDHLKWVDGTSSDANLTVSNAEGAWYTFSADAMMESYLYPLGHGGDIVSSFSTLPAHIYDVYVYAHGQPGSEKGVIHLAVDDYSLGTKSTSTSNNWDSGTWIEGDQYVLFRDVNIYEGAVVRVTSRPGASGLAVMNGVQLVVKGPALPPPPRITLQPTGGIAFEGDAITLSVTATGDGLHYQWTLNGTALEGQTNATLQIASFSAANAGIYKVDITGDTGNVSSAPAYWILASRTAGALLNIDFAAHLDPRYVAKSGPAAFGIASNDVWNVYSPNVITSNSVPPIPYPFPPPIGGVYTNSLDATITNLIWADGTVSLASLSVANARASSFLSTPDPMLSSYLYPMYRRGNIVSTLSNLPPAVYDVVIYAHGEAAEQNAVIKLTVEGAPVGTKETSPSTNWNSSGWVPENQFVIFQNVNIYQGAVAQITASPGVAGLASINGLQLLVKGPALPPPPKILEQPQGGVAFAGDRVVLNVSAQGENLQYQWSLNDVPIPGATQSTVEIASFSSADVGSYTVAVSGPSGTAVSDRAEWILASRAPGTLLNINYTAHLNPVFSKKTGPAAFGISTNDTWNVYSRDVDDLFNWRQDGAIGNLLWADGTVSVASLAVTNAEGAWYTFSADPMMESYLYPLSRSGDIYTKLSNLPAQRYNIFVYAHGQPANENGRIELKVGGTVIAAKSTTSGEDWGIPVWTEGNQYVLFGDVEVPLDADVEIISHPGDSGLAVINGIQLAAQQPVVQTFAKSMIKVNAITQPAASETAQFSTRVRFSGQTPRLMLEGGANAVYYVEASADLQNWRPLGYYQSGTGLITIEDVEGIGAAHQFYRATLAQ